MLKKNIISATTIYVCTSHTEKILKSYFNVLEKIFKKIQTCESGKINALSLLDAQESFKGLRSK